MTLSSLLRIAAAAQLAIALLNLFLVRLLDWKADLDRLPLLLREVFHVHCWFKPGGFASSRCGDSNRDGGCESQPGARFGLERRIDALARGGARAVRRSFAVYFNDGANDLGVDAEVRSGNCEPGPCHLSLAGWRGSTFLAAPRLVAVVLLCEHPMSDQPA